jgi:hypothetical protein
MMENAPPNAVRWVIFSVYLDTNSLFFCENKIIRNKALK